MDKTTNSLFLGGIPQDLPGNIDQTAHLTSYSRLVCAYRHSYHGVVWFPFCLLVEAKLGRRLCRLDIADYQNAGLWVGDGDMGEKMSTCCRSQTSECHIPV